MHIIQFVHFSQTVVYNDLKRNIKNEKVQNMFFFLFPFSYFQQITNQTLYNVSLNFLIFFPSIFAWTKDKCIYPIDMTKLNLIKSSKINKLMYVISIHNRNQISSYVKYNMNSNNVSLGCTLLWQNILVPIDKPFICSNLFQTYAAGININICNKKDSLSLEWKILHDKCQEYTTQL